MSAPTVPRPTQAGPPKTPTPPPPVSEADAAKARKSIAKLDEVLAMVTRALLTLGGGALIFTCVNVTRFGVSHEIPWYIAWMLDPLASLALITVLYVDGVLAEHGGDYKPGGWPFLLRWTAGLSTWVMNCWTSLYPDGLFHFVPQKPDAGGILLHSVAPALLILLAEAATGYRKYATRRRGELTAIIARFEAARIAEREAAAKRAREEAEREAAAKREEAEREAARREREEIARLENERRAAEIEAAERTRRTEIEAERERLALTERTAEIEASRRKAEAEIEDRRRREEWEREQAERDREAARQAEIVKAEAQAEALRKEAEAAAEAERIRAEAEARALEEAKKLKRQRALERAAAKARGTSESAGARASISAGRSSESGVALSAVPALTASDNGGRIPREVREKQRDEAERYIAKCSLSGITPDLERLGNQYGKGETWVGDRVRAAKRRLAEEDGFEESVIADALDVFEDDDSDSAGAA
ncbi:MULTISPECIES: hypothetical protein [unclassified Streptomyces]|uniref:hypothetical protein n=1 Tax=unclassified Streptomyces TaxID=2593676 RepID=UPI00136D274B|nr:MULTISPECIES: hypothetical protein [unclassified Streptomyces]NEA05833.1 hypothetical protein [Streptomyces sp. SID10116]MYY80858.1 hypothetical protein [Streptomyces sp. SID335]MYZ13305.1 hypothetical protein [Streptomyces sp. SID337]NDZ85684.1 hypothetical protein [Streptomyces sp. SID10115]NEB49984.1 hypothetical protein [Streptomyces sp. SID339]